MIVYTAEDFAQANLATRDKFGVARRADPRLTHQWHVYGGTTWRLSDEEMAADGWVPVVEGGETIAALRHDLAVAQKEMADLRRENRRLDAEADGAISLDGLEAAWESAEQADECREGDVLIIRDDEDNYLVRRMDDRSDLDSTARILSRAPGPEPWVELAGVLQDEVPGGAVADVDHLAERLYSAGVRVTGGGE